MLWFSNYRLCIFYFFYFSLIHLLTVIHVNIVNRRYVIQWVGMGGGRRRVKMGQWPSLEPRPCVVTLGSGPRVGGVWTKGWRSCCPCIILVIATRPDKPDLVIRAEATVFSDAQGGSTRFAQLIGIPLAELRAVLLWVTGLTARGCFDWEKQAPTQGYFS